MAELFGSVKRVRDAGWAFSHGNEGWPNYLYKYFPIKEYGSSAAAEAAALAYRKDPELQNKLLKMSKPYKAAQKWGVPYEEWIKKSEVERLKYPADAQNKRIAELKKAKDIKARTFTYKNKSYVMPTKLPKKSLPYYKDFIRYLNDYIINRKPGTSILEAISTIPAYKNEPVVGRKKLKWEREQGRIWRDLSEYFLKGKKGKYRTLATASFFDDINIKNLIPKKDHLEIANLKQARTAQALTRGTVEILKRAQSGELVLGNPLVKPIAEFMSKNPNATKEALISAIKISEGKNLTDKQIIDGAVRAHSNIIARAMAIGRREKISETRFIALKDLDSASLRVGANALQKMFPDQIHRTFQKTVEEYYKDKPRLLKKSLDKLRNFEVIKRKIIKEFNLKGSSLRDAPFQFDHPISIKALERSGDLAGAVRTNPIAGDVNQFKKYLDNKLNEYQKNIIKGTNVDVNLGKIESLQNINKTLLGKLAGDFTMDRKGIIKVIDYGAKDILDPKYNILESLKENLALGKKIKETTALRDPALVGDVEALFGKEGSSKFFKGAEKIATLDESKIANFINIFNSEKYTIQRKVANALNCGDSEGGRIGYALGTATIRCVNQKLTNEPVQSSMRLRATEGIGKMRGAATNFLKLLGRVGTKAAPLAALAVAGAAIEPVMKLVKQFRSDDPTTYLTDENQQKGMLIATIEGETPKVDEEILKWQYPGLAAATLAGAVPGAKTAFQERRGVGPRGPLPGGVGKTRAALGLKGVLGKALGASFSPLAVAATLPLGIAAQRKAGTEWGDIATDPGHWFGPAFASSGYEMASRGIKNPMLLKALRLGIKPSTLRMISSKFGLPGLLISGGMWGYDKWKNRSINDPDE